MVLPRINNILSFLFHVKMQVAFSYACFPALILTLLVLPLNSNVDAIYDTILVGEPLTASETRVSNNGIFKLGFFNLQDTNKWYVGIWYAQVPQQTIVWIANRDKPLANNTSAVFNLTESGHLVLSHRDSVIWSTNGTIKASSAVISDTSNLVLLSEENKSQIVWQSFDTPGNVWMPGMTITLSRTLRSWKTRWDPSPGLFSQQMDPSGAGQVVLLWNNSVKYWESGIWDDKNFTLAPLTIHNIRYNFSVHSDGESKYVTFSVDPLLVYLSRFILLVAVSGEARIYFLQDNTTWILFWSQPGKQCAVYAGCGAYALCNQNNVQSCNCLEGFKPKDNEAWESQEWAAGCVRKTAQDCRDGNREGFLQLTGVSTSPGAIASERPMTAEDCKKACLSYCSCTAYSHGTNIHSPTCQLWFTDLFNLYEDTSNGSSLFVRVAVPDLPKSSSKTIHKAYDAGAAVGGVVAVVAISAIIFAVLVRRRRSFTKSVDYGTPAVLTLFSYKELEVATHKFSERLGGGGFGSVFKGTLPDKSLVAVKILEVTGDGQLEKQFRTEVSTLGIIQHMNLVRLRGFCCEGSSRLLVYDFMPNGSLNTFLFNESNALDWKTRFRIALGVARGILYLHEECRDCIIHCDIKPENILLDSDFCPKVADFGLAKLVGREFTNVLTTARGTRGYVAPEWLWGLPITPKADVYSFGMTLFEIIAGRRNIDGDADSSKVFFPAWAVSQIGKGNIMAVLDKKIENGAEGEEVRRAAMVAGWCIQDEEEARPSMREVVRILEGTVDVAAPPIPKSIGNMEKTSSFLLFWDKSERGNGSNFTLSRPRD